MARYLGSVVVEIHALCVKTKCCDTVLPPEVAFLDDFLLASRSGGGAFALYSHTAGRCSQPRLSWLPPSRARHGRVAKPSSPRRLGSHRPPFWPHGRGVAGVRFEPGGGVDYGRSARG